MVDVATPLTFERYTGNWKGSFEGWLITPQNASTMTKRMPQTLPGLQRFCHVRAVGRAGRRAADRDSVRPPAGAGAVQGGRQEV